MAELELNVSANNAVRQTDRARDSLDRYTKQAKSAEQQVNRLGRSQTTFGRAANDNLPRAQRQMTGLGSATRGAGRQVGLLAAGFISLGAAIAIAASAGRAFREFDAALGEASTLIQGTEQELAFLEDRARSLSTAFGTTATEQVEGFYQAISAGAGSVEEAAETLDVANRLAIAGVTSVETAVDALTGVLNAYGDQVEGAAAVSDTLFIGVRAGKTTVDELSGALGKVVPLASIAGVSFDELTAAVAALTKVNISTAESTTGLRAILASVAKPTKEAQEAAKALGIEFNVAAIQANGFQAFIQDVAEKTGGSTEALAQLFGGVEALVPVLALSGRAGDDFNAILDDMANKAGTTDTAFNKVSQTLSQQYNVEIAKARDNLIPLGELFTELSVGALQTFNNAIARTAGAGKQASENLATNFTFLSEVTTIAFSSIGPAVGDAVISAMNTLLSGIKSGLNEVLSVVNATSERLGGLGSIELFNIEADTITNRFAGAGDQAGKAFNDAVIKRNAALSRTLTDFNNSRAGVDPRGNQIGFQNGNGGAANDNTPILPILPILPTGSGGSSGRSSVSEFQREVNSLQKSIMELSNEADNFDLSILAEGEQEALADYGVSALEATGALIKLGTEQELVNASLASGKEITPQLAETIDGLADAYANAEVTLIRLRGEQEFLTKQRDAVEELAQTFTGSFSQSLKEGESLWKSFGDAGLSVLDSIISKINDDLSKSIADAFTGKSSSGGGGIFGSLLGGILGGGGTPISPLASAAFASGSGGLFAKGAAFNNGNVVPFARGGVFNTPTAFPMSGGRTGLFAEDGPEAIIPLARGSDGKLGVTSLNNRPMELTVNVTSDASPMLMNTIDVRSRDIAVNVVQDSAPAIIQQSSRVTGQNLQTLSQKNRATVG